MIADIVAYFLGHPVYCAWPTLWRMSDPQTSDVRHIL